jgi:hypothetical protein
MKRITTIIATSLLLAATAVPAGARSHAAYDGSRIFWDLNSLKIAFPSGIYSRLIQLQDGRLMAAAEGGGGIMVSYSSDNGSTWSASELIVRAGDRVPLAVPDLIQLTDGTIIVGYNPRPSSPYSEDRRFGIRAMRSTDNGATWSSPIFIYDASWTYEDGCWEPSFLELPSGELQCYFANEGPFTTSSEQEISVSRSFDGGLTWSEPDRVSYRAGSRDGMPVPILTDNDDIAVIVEDNGQPGYSGFRATVVRSSLADNWSEWVDGSSSKRNMIFANAEDKTDMSAAPYLRKLKTGETIASWQGMKGRTSELDMFVAVGDVDARNFKATTQPFTLDQSTHSLWNSVAVVDDGSVFAVGSHGTSSGGTEVKVIKGYPMTGFTANYGTPTIDGAFTNETWTKKNAQQVFMGQITRNRATMDFLYDRDNLYFFARVIDRTIFTDKVDNDGIFLYFDTKNVCDTYPQEGMFKLFLNVNGEVEFWSGNSNKWVSGDTPDGLQFVVKTKSSYYDMEVAIPWKSMGYDAAPMDNDMRCNIEVRDRRDGSIVTDAISETDARQSWTWPEFHLTYDDRASVGNVMADQLSATVTAKVSGRKLHLTSTALMNQVSVFAASGQQLHKERPLASEATIDMGGFVGVAVAEVKMADGSQQRIKFIVK